MEFSSAFHLKAGEVKLHQDPGSSERHDTRGGGKGGFAEIQPGLDGLLGGITKRKWI